LAALSLFGLAVLVAMTVLAVNITRQAEFADLAFGLNSADVSRPFVQLQRETLRLRLQMPASVEAYDPDAFQLQYDLVQSRIEVIRQANIQTSLPEASLEAAGAIEAMWTERVQPAIERWQADPENESARTELTTALVDIEFLANRTEIEYQLTRGRLINDLGHTTQSLLIAMAAALLLVIVFFVVVAYSTVLFIRTHQRDEADKRAALAAEAAATEASKFKDQFLAIMSHELRTPLNAIIGFLGIMGMGGTLDERNTHMVQRSRANAERLLTIINDILDISKIESGRFELVYSLIAPRNLVQKWESQMEVLAKQKGLNFTVNVDNSLPDRISMDEDAVTKVAINLLSNAFKFTDKGDVSLKLSAKGDEWMLVASDSGIGIPAHMHERIFESFRQVDGSYQRPYGGTGLGLSIVQHLVTAMNGTVRVKSELGEGSTFTVTLPLRQTEAETRQEQSIGVLA
jgi:signal transduction histidine kinase